MIVVGKFYLFVMGCQHRTVTLFMRTKVNGYHDSLKIVVYVVFNFLVLIK